MTWTFLEIAVIVLASSQVVETYRHGSLFQKTRQAAANAAERGVLLGQLFSCPFCFSHYPALLLTLWCAVANEVPAPSMWLPAVWLAAVRLSQLLNDVSHGWCRSPYRGEDNLLDQR